MKMKEFGRYVKCSLGWSNTTQNKYAGNVHYSAEDEKKTRRNWEFENQW